MINGYRYLLSISMFHQLFWIWIPSIGWCKFRIKRNVHSPIISFHLFVRTLLRGIGRGRATCIFFRGLSHTSIHFLRSTTSHSIHQSKIIHRANIPFRPLVLYFSRQIVGRPDDEVDLLELHYEHLVRSECTDQNLHISLLPLRFRIRFVQHR